MSRKRERAGKTLARVANLPVWAQEYIDLQITKKDNAEKKYDDLLASRQNQGSGVHGQVFTGSPTGSEPVFMMGPQDRVIFVIGNKKTNHRLAVYVSGDVLEIRASTKNMITMPVSSNAIRVKPRQ